MINVLIAPTGTGNGSTTISLGLLRALDAQGLKVGFVKPIAPNYNTHERSSHLVRTVLQLQTPNPMHLTQVQQRISDGMLDRVLEDAVALHAQVTQDCDVVLIEGLAPDRSEPYTAKLNAEIAKALSADVLLVGSGQNRSADEIRHDLKVQQSIFGGTKGHLLGLIINKVGSSSQHHGIPSIETSTDAIADKSLCSEEECWQLGNPQCPVVGVIPWQNELVSPRMLDIAHALNAKVLNQGELDSRRVLRIALCARTLPNMLDTLRPGSLVVTPGDRDDIMVAAAMATNNGTPLAGLLLTGGLLPHQGVVDLCQSALKTGIPVLQTNLDTFTTADRLARMNTNVPMDDVDRVQRIMENVAEHVDSELLMQRLGAPHASRLSPAAFRYQLVAKACSDKQRVVLPEGDEPRTVQAAAICQQRGIADCVLIGEPERIQQVAQAHEISLPDDLQIIDPQDVREHYVPAMIELRKHKQLSEPMALAQLEDNVVLGTMMLAEDHVDGLVSGAVHTTANTIRPALQLIKTAPGAKLVSSVFFMGLPDQVLVYGDCAVNPNPNAEELADIAIQSAHSAKAMGIHPKVAMISYSTGQSGSGADVDKVRAATHMIQQTQPELTVDGPLQYDAATTASVAQSKAPDSAVAGQATVLIFPDLNTGNTTYKAVQRSANVISIGPMLQGLAKPVNDLSRGALVEDIVYTIALTAIQAQHCKAQKSNNE